jgi:glycosyltransferase involved in cell wall biosynthesis
MRIVQCVTNDINTDRRVMRTSLSLLKLPAEVLIIGRKLKNSKKLDHKGFQIHRMRLLFNKGPMFYAEYNIRLFFFLLITRADLMAANDLDTLPAVYLASYIRNIPLVYDCHEYFTEVPELVSRPFVKKIWEKIEALILPHVKHTYTVSSSISDDYKIKYGIHMRVIRNLPLWLNVRCLPVIHLKEEGEKLIIYVGSLNVGRGLESAIMAMQFLKNVRLIIIGTGDVEKELKELSRSLSLESCVTFTGRMMPDELQQYIVQADLGISLEEKLGLNYFYALPNKVFDYIQACVPVLVSDLPEMKALVNQYNVGMVARTSEPLQLATIMGDMIYNTEKRSVWKANLEKASLELCWENEENKLTDIYRKALT